MRSALLMLSFVTLAAATPGCGGPPAAAREQIRVRLANGDSAGAIATYKQWRGNGDDDPDSLRALALTSVWSCFQSSDPQVRAGAARLAERLNDERLFNAVVGLLRDQDPVVRATAAAAILRGHPDAPGILADSLHGSDPRARAIAVDALGRKLKGDAVADLRAALADPDPGVRAAACDALGDIGDRDSLATLTGLAGSDSSGLVRASALAALGKVNGPETHVTVRLSLEDPYLGARLAAVRTLEILRGDEAVPELTRIAKALPMPENTQRVAASSLDKMLALRAGVILARRGDHTTVRPVFEAALTDKDWIVRAAAANAAFEIAGKSDTPALLAKTARDPIPEVRLAAARALLHAGDRETATHTFQSCFGLSEDLQIQAATDLAPLGDAKALAVFTTLLASSKADVRRAAASAAPHDSPVLSALLDALADPDDAVRLAAAATIL